MKVSSTALFAPDVSGDLYTNRRVWNDELVKATTRARVSAIWEAHGSQFSCVNISTALISFAKWEITVDAEKCICSMLKHYLENHRLIRVRDAAGTVDSLARMHFTGKEIEQIQKTLFAVIAQKVLEKRVFFDKPHPASLVHLLQNFVDVDTGSDALFRALEPQVVLDLASFNPQDVTKIATLYSKKGCRAELLFQAIQNQVMQSIVHYTPSQLSHIAFACSSFAIGVPEFYSECYFKIKKGLHKFDAAAIESCLYVYAQSNEKEALLCILGRSSLQIDVEEALVRCGYECKSQHVLDGVFVGIFIPSENLVIEVCEKSSYYRADPNELAAVFLIKKRILESRGYKMLHLPYFEWSWSKKVQEQYLKELIAREYKPINELTYNPRREF